VRLGYEKGVAKGIDERLDLARPTSFDEITTASGSRMIFTVVGNLEKEDKD
jgi:hypothetical protein